MSSGESRETESEPISAAEGSSRPQAATPGPITRLHRSPSNRLIAAIAASVILLPMSTLSLFQWINESNDGEYTFNENRGNTPLPSSIEIRARYKSTFHSSNQDEAFSFNFTLDSFNPEEGAIQARLSISLDPAKFAARFPGRAAPKEVTILLTAAFDILEVKVPVRETGVIPQDAKDASIRLETWGDSRPYPSDTYGSNYYVDPRDDLGPVAYSVLASPEFSQYSMQARVGTSHFNLLIERSAPQKAWTYILAWLPILLLAALVYSGLRAPKMASVSAIEAAVGLLALLPIRQVLVPTSVSTITNVDLILGIEFTLFIAWMTYAVMHLGSKTAPTDSAD